MQLKRSLSERRRSGMRFSEKIQTVQGDPLTATGIDMLQVNMGYRCNLSCKHCHVEGGPGRQEIMGRETADAVLRVMRSGKIRTLDITGGAPELNPHFRYLAEEAQNAGCHVVVRTNLAIFFEEGMEDLFGWYDRMGFELVASLPSCRQEQVDRVRGSGVFEKSIAALKDLNSLGYGTGNGRSLNLVYNPAGAFLPPEQMSLEGEYRKELHSAFGITFNRLYTFANMPIGRFRQFLLRTGNFEMYMAKLVDAFNPQTLCGLMCRRLLNVGWDGRLYDCDFNQMTGAGLTEGGPSVIGDFDHERLASRRIAVDDHCFGCTAGQGST
ncbi:MAG TPA: arsenosugar biosynthesis radical SAM (seleno)protein ArsS [Thermodesulfovibrionales bacterium]|nr:arsenosugar biosynthesis radical SAM (seleno)protein ArsS [Thermodesulfovibrionales bacterium]